MIGVIVLFVIVLAFVYYGAQGKFDELTKKLPSGFRRWPIIGQAYLFFGGKRGMMEGFKKLGMDAISRGGLSTFWIGNNCFLMVADPNTAQVLLKNCLEKQETTTRAMKFFIGNGSLYAPVPTWRPRRKLLAPTFSAKRLNRFMDVFAIQSAVLVEKLQSTVGKGTFPVWKYLTTYTFDAVCETTLGVRLNVQENPDHPYLETLDRITDSISQRILKPWLHPDVLYCLFPHYKEAQNDRHWANEFIDKIIATKRKEIAEKQTGSEYTDDTDSSLEFKSLVEMLLEETDIRKRFSDVEIREEALVMSAAGTDTSAVGACFALAMLARHPEVQDKAVAELQEVLDNERPVTGADLPKLKYLEAVIKESLRLYPPVPVIVRTASNGVELDSGIVLPEGTGIMVNIWAIHHNPQYWGPDVEEFKPERFFQPLVHSEQFMPFSYSFRNCLGYQYAMMSMKTVLATVLRTYRVLPPKEMDAKALKKPIPVSFDIMMKADDKFRIQLETRESVRLSGNRTE